MTNQLLSSMGTSTWSQYLAFSILWRSSCSLKTSRMWITGRSVLQGSSTVVNIRSKPSSSSGATFSRDSRISSEELSSTRRSWAAASRAVTRPVPHTTAARKGAPPPPCSSRKTLK